MPYDAGAAAAVCFDLNSCAADGRVEKIFQPVKDQIVLQVYAKGERRNICLDADANSPKVYMTNRTAENPPSMSAFYGILRKYLMNARIKGVSLVGFDRIFEFEFDASDEMGFHKTLYLYAECIRKQSNLILCRSDGADSGLKIIGALKTVDISMSRLRQVLNGFNYIPPYSGDKINPLTVNGTADIDENSAQQPLCDFLLSKYQGLSPLTAREIAFRASKSLRDAFILAGDADKQALDFYFDEFMNKIKNNDFTPTVLFDKNEEKAENEENEENGSLFDFSYTEIKQYQNKAASKTFDSMSELVDYYFEKKDHDNRIKQKSHDILKVLSGASSRQNKKIKFLENELRECAEREKFRIYGDLITANIYKLEKGAEIYRLENFYDEEEPGRIIEITAEKNFTPAQNAQKFYKKYNKLKTAEYHLTKQMESAADDIVYIDSVLFSLSRPLSERELTEIREEISESGLVKPPKPGKTAKSGGPKKSPRQLPVSKPEEYTSKNGFKILCGKNNKQNDYLTFKTAAKNDIWFHAQKIPGSHVILMCGNTGMTPSEKDIEDAAKIAAVYSKGKNMPAVPVDYTYARYVKKPNGAKPGYVTYANFKTTAVRPDKEM